MRMKRSLRIAVFLTLAAGLAYAFVSTCFHASPRFGGSVLIQVPDGFAGTLQIELLEAEHDCGNHDVTIDPAGCGAIRCGYPFASSVSHDAIQVITQSGTPIAFDYQPTKALDTMMACRNIGRVPPRGQSAPIWWLHIGYIDGYRNATMAYHNALSIAQRTNR